LENQKQEKQLFPENFFGIKRKRANKAKEALSFKRKTLWTLSMTKGLMTKRRAGNEFEKATNIKPNQKP